MQNLNSIKNIIFDLGGVLLNIDFTLTTQAFEKLGVYKFDAIYSKAGQNPLFDNFESGKYSPEEFRMELKKFLPKEINPMQLDYAWNEMLLDLPPARLELLSTLKNNYRLFLLSNTNAIHIGAYSSYLNKLYGFVDLSHIFEKEYYSFQIGLRKPNVEIFDFVLKENNLIAQETLFIDDSLQHIEGAQKLGLNTFHLKTNQSILDINFEIN